MRSRGSSLLSSSNECGANKKMWINLGKVRMDIEIKQQPRTAAERQSWSEDPSPYWDGKVGNDGTEGTSAV